METLTPWGVDVGRKYSAVNAGSISRTMPAGLACIPLIPRFSIRRSLPQGWTSSVSRQTQEDRQCVWPGLPAIKSVLQSPKS